MQAYHSNDPIVFIHVPKCGGTSTRTVFEYWFHKNLFLHYKQFNNLPCTNISDFQCFYGHFNSKFSFGVKDYYPEVTQYIALFRNPIQKHLSVYTTALKRLKQGKPAGIKDSDMRFLNSVDDFFINVKSNLLNPFPFEFTPINYEKIINDNFIHILLTERLEVGVYICSLKLKKPFICPPKLNIGNQAPLPSEKALEIFKENNYLEFLIYNYLFSINNIQIPKLKQLQGSFNLRKFMLYKKLKPSNYIPY